MNHNDIKQDVTQHSSSVEGSFVGLGEISVDAEGNTLLFQKKDVGDVADDGVDEVRMMGVMNSDPIDQRRQRDDAMLWRKFQFQDHSLVLYASNVAACTGYNPFVRCPEMMMQHVYQGRGGMALLKHDMELLGLDLSLKTDEEELMDIALQAGEATANKVKQALEVKRGERELESIETAWKLRQEVAKEAEKSNKLSKQQLKILEEGTRQSVDTGCGHSWEDSALDQYEKECGWEVHDRNAECRQWRFKRIERSAYDEDHNSSKPEESRKRKRAEDFIPSLEPLGPASVPFRNNQVDESNQKQSQSPNNIDAAEGNGCASNSTPETLAASKPYVVIRGMVDGIREELAPNRLRSTCVGNKDDHTTNTTIHGGGGDDDDDDSWLIRRVIVECKHRMRSILPAPRFYEVIQSVVYCLMYDAEEVDIVQVLRTKRKSDSMTVRNTRATQNNQSIRQTCQSQSSEGQSKGGDKTNDIVVKPKTGRLMTDFYDKVTTTKENVKPKDYRGQSEDKEIEEVDGGIDPTASSKGTKQPEEGPLSNSVNEEDQPRQNPAKKSSPVTSKMQLLTSRISLYDSSMDHVSNWNNIILPNLRRWVDAVYRIRSSDEKRYLLLNSMATANSQIKDDDTNDNYDDGGGSGSHNHTVARDALRTAWSLLLAECPFLEYGPSGDKYRRDCF